MTMTLLFPAIGLIAVVTAFYGMLILPTRWLKVERVHCDLGIGVSILQLSDLHVERLRVKPEQLERVLRAENPDYICITGDFTKRPPAFRSLGPTSRSFKPAAFPPTLY
ncbi:hypothetical protein LJK88_39525 [Paenibacillus sp. P26]|nr:hypothetical protein LJK88_39525 [Paenibacillus sp. P26]